MLWATFLWIVLSTIGLISGTPLLVIRWLKYREVRQAADYSPRSLIARNTLTNLLREGAFLVLIFAFFTIGFVGLVAPGRGIGMIVGVIGLFMAVGSMMYSSIMGWIGQRGLDAQARLDEDAQTAQEDDTFVPPSQSSPSQPAH